MKLESRASYRYRHWWWTAPTRWLRWVRAWWQSWWGYSRVTCAVCSRQWRIPGYAEITAGSRWFCPYCAPTYWAAQTQAKSHE